MGKVAVCASSSIYTVHIFQLHAAFRAVSVFRPVQSGYKTYASYNGSIFFTPTLHKHK